ncbi:MAG: hypothetical protein ACE5LA_05755 [Dehalococcoidales bacterium]
MSKYTDLTEWLREQTEDSVALTFAEVEKIIGKHLPLRARKYFRWWDNTRGTMADYAIFNAGFKTVMVDMENEKVKFQRIQEV